MFESLKFYCISHLFSGLPPDVLTVDHVNIYWYNKNDGRLYTLDKESGKLSVTAFPGVTDMFPYGAHLQPLPGINHLEGQLSNHTSRKR